MSPGVSGTRASPLAAALVFAGLVVPTAAFADQDAATRKVLVHVEATGEVGLEQEQMDGWTLVCSAPCDLRLPTGFRYRAGSRGAPTSKPFTLQAPAGGSETLEVTPGSQLASAGGTTLIVLGATSATIGFTILDVVAIVDNLNDPSEGGIVLGSLMTLGAGVLAFVGGMAMVQGSVTDVSQTVGIAAPQPAPADDPKASLPDPVRTGFATESVPEGLRLPRAERVPILTLRF